MNKDTVYRQDVIDALIPLPGIGRRAIDKVNSLPSADRWIPCKERQPEESGLYLVTELAVNYQKEYVLRIRVAQCDVSQYACWRGPGGVVKAWMPLPEIYGG